MSKCDKHNTNFTIQEVREYPGKTIEVCLDCERERLARMRELFTPRHGCGPGEALPADTRTEGARLPRKTREELMFEVSYSTGRSMDELRKYDGLDWCDAAMHYQRLADLAGQIAGRTE